MSYENKVVWITGASSGIGKALAYELSKRGAELILSSRKEKSLLEVKAKCHHPEKVKVVPLDLERHEEMEGIVRTVLGEVEHIDFLINNGGISQRSFVKDTDIQVDEKIFRINFLGTIALTKAVLPAMIARKSGKIVTVTSVVGKYATPKRSSYAAGKHALHGFMDSLRAEVYYDGIKVQIICPGYVNTNISINALTSDGSPQGTLDKTTANGIKPDQFAQKMANAMLKNRDEVYICGAKERLGLYAKRFFPSLLNKMVRKVNVT